MNFPTNQQQPNGSPIVLQDGQAVAAGAASGAVTGAAGGAAGSAPNGALGELVKSLSAIESMIASGQVGRKQQLLSKALSGDITAAEATELSGLVNPTAATSPVAEGFSKSMAGARQQIQGSEYFAAIHDTTVDTTTQLIEALQKSDGARADQTLVLAKTLRLVAKNQVELSKALDLMAKSMGVALSRPVRDPTAVTGAQPAERTFQGQQRQGLTYDEVQQTLHLMFAKSEKEGRDGMAICGVDIADAIIKYETSFQATNGQQADLTPELADELKLFRRSLMAGAAV